MSKTPRSWQAARSQRVLCSYCVTALLLAIVPQVATAAEGTPFLVSVTLAGGGEAIVQDALNSVVDWVDACIILDTGISDSTLRVARETIGDKLVVKHFPWVNSFSAARNAGLDAAAELGASWAVLLDTDERLRYGGNASEIRKYLQQTHAALLNVMHESMTYHKSRFFRLPRAGSFQGATHEWFKLEGGATESKLDTGHKMIFQELAKDAAAIQRKAHRDIDILSHEVAVDPDDQRWWCYLGDAYDIAGDCPSAVKAWRTCGRMTHGWDEEGAWCMYRAAGCLGRSGRWPEALEAITQGMMRHAGLPELPWYAGWLAYQAGRYKEAVSWSHMSIALGCYKGLCMDRTVCSHPPGNYEGPYDVLMWSLRQLGDKDGAAEAELLKSEAEAARLFPGLTDE